MRVLVIGATGGIGRKVVELGIARGLRMTAFVRSPEKLAELAERSDVVRGNPLDATAMRRVADGHEAVISVLGASGPGRRTLLEDGARSLATALEGTSLRRVLLVSAAMLFEDTGLVGALLRTTLLRNGASDARAAERILAESPLDWTVVRPPRLTHGPLTRRWRVAADRLPPGWSGAISRADVADCLLDEIQRRDHVRRVVGVAIC